MTNKENAIRLLARTANLAYLLHEDSFPGISNASFWISSVAAARTQRCVLFFDEFDVIGKERGDVHETGADVRTIVADRLKQSRAAPTPSSMGRRDGRSQRPHSLNYSPGDRMRDRLYWRSWVLPISQHGPMLSTLRIATLPKGALI